MSRKVINILFIVGSCLYVPGIMMIIWGYVALFQATSPQDVYSSSGYSSTSSFNDGFSTFIVLFLVGAVITSLGGITVLVARIGALIEAGKAQEWVWFILMLIFGWIVLLIYLIAGPKPKPALQHAVYPAPYAVPGQFWPGYPPQTLGAMPFAAQPWPGYPPQAPGAMPPPVQPWPGYPPQAPGAMPPSEHPWSEYPPPAE